VFAKRVDENAKCDAIANAIMRVYAYEYFEPTGQKYIASGCYATLARIEGRNLAVRGSICKPWLVIMRDQIEVEESRLADGFFQPNKKRRR
jgi:hypothetical protein